MTGHSQNVADNLANADILAVVPHQLEGAGWGQGDIEHPTATDVRLAAVVGAAHHIGADEPRLNSSSGSFFMSLISKAGRPSSVAVIVANVADMAHPATAPAVSRAATIPTFLRCPTSAVMNVFMLQIRYDKCCL